MKLATFEDFVKLANIFYATIGIEPYQKHNNVKRNAMLISFIFYAGLINLNWILMAEILYVTNSLVNRENFIEATMTMSYIGFVLVGNFKMIFIYKRKNALTKLVHGLQEIFPKTLELQMEYNLQHYLKLCSRITISFSLLYMILIWTYNLFSIIQYFVYDLWLHVRQVDQSLPYFIYTPWNWQNHWSYYWLYALQDLAGYTSATGQIASDLLLTACATQLVMHYDFTAQKLASYRVKSVKKDSYLCNLEFLRYIVKYHTKLLDLSDQLNDVFGASLLLNFAASSFVICFVAFQITTGATPETLLKLFLFLISSIAQVYLICYYGQQLKDASSNVSKAVYNQDWFKADNRYMKMLVFISKRAQKPALLQATSFVVVSRETLTKILQISYKFFALLRTMYVKK